MEKDYILEGTCLRVQMPRELDHEAGEQVKRMTDRIMMENPVQSMKLDFKQTEFMDSSGIGMIISRYRMLGMRKGSVKVTGASERIKKILLISGMNKIVDVCEN